MPGRAVLSRSSPTPAGGQCSVGVQRFETPICLPVLMLLPTQGTPALPSLGRTGLLLAGALSWPRVLHCSFFKRRHSKGPPSGHRDETRQRRGAWERSLCLRWPQSRRWLHTSPDVVENWNLGSTFWVPLSFRRELAPHTAQGARSNSRKGRGEQQERMPGAASIAPSAAPLSKGQVAGTSRAGRAGW